MSPSAEVEHLLKRLAAASAAATSGPVYETLLDPRTHALVVIGAAICTDASRQTFRALVQTALNAGATREEVLGTFLAVAPEAGGPRVVSVAPKISLALGYDIDAAFENE